jgi:hypothetical protein
MIGGIQSYPTVVEKSEDVPYYALPRRGSVREQPNRHRQLDLSSPSESLGCGRGQQEQLRM